MLKRAVSYLSTGGSAGLALGGARGLGGTGAEAVLEALLDLLQVAHATSAGVAAALTLERPVVVADALGGVTAGGAALLLDVVGALSAADARSILRTKRLEN